MTLKSFVKSIGGVRHVAKELGVTEHAVRHWLRGGGTPKMAHIFSLIDMSRGKLTIIGIMKETKRSQK